MNTVEFDEYNDDEVLKKSEFQESDGMSFNGKGGNNEWDDWTSVELKVGKFADKGKGS